MHCRAFTRPLPRVRDPLRKKKRKRKFSYFPVLPDLFRSFGVCHTSAALHPPLDATYLQPWGPSNLLLRPSALIPSNYLTHTSDSKKLIYISFLRPPLCSVLGCLSSAASRHLRLLPISVLLSFVVPRSRHSAPTSLIESSLRARVITPPLLSPDRSSFL